MGLRASAMIVYGQVIAEADSEEAEHYHEEEGGIHLWSLLAGTPLDYDTGGYYDLPSHIVYLRGVQCRAGEYEPLALGSDPEGVGVLPEVDVAQLVNAKKLWRHLDVLPGEFKPQWLLVPSYG